MQGGQQTIVADLDVERENQFVTIMNVPVSPYACYTANLSIQRGGLAWGMWTLSFPRSLSYYGRCCRYDQVRQVWMRNYRQNILATETPAQKEAHRPINMLRAREQR